MQHVGLRLRGCRACPGAQERDHKAGSLEHGFLLGGAALPVACPQQVAYFPTMKELTRSSERSLRNCKAAPDEGARLALRCQRAFMPMAQQQMAEQRQQQEDRDA